MVATSTYASIHFTYSTSIHPSIRVCVHTDTRTDRQTGMLASINIYIHKYTYRPTSSVRFRQDSFGSRTGARKSFGGGGGGEGILMGERLLYTSLLVFDMCAHHHRRARVVARHHSVAVLLVNISRHEVVWVKRARDHHLPNVNTSSAGGGHGRRCTSACWEQRRQVRRF